MFSVLWRQHYCVSLLIISAWAGYCFHLCLSVCLFGSRTTADSLASQREISTLPIRFSMGAWGPLHLAPTSSGVPRISFLGDTKYKYKFNYGAVVSEIIYLAGCRTCRLSLWGTMHVFFGEGYKSLYTPWVRPFLYLSYFWWGCCFHRRLSVSRITQNDYGWICHEIGVMGRL